MSLKSFRSYQLALKFHFACESLQCSRTLRDQLLRASSSIALNLAEGSAKPTAKDRNRYYFISLGSLRECQAILELSHADPEGEIVAIADNLGSHLFKLTSQTTRARLGRSESSQAIKRTRYVLPDLTAAGEEDEDNEFNNDAD